MADEKAHPTGGKPEKESTESPKPPRFCDWWERWKWTALVSTLLAACIIAFPWIRELIADWLFANPVATGLGLLITGLIAGQLITSAARPGRDKWAQQVRDITVIALVLVTVLGVGIIFLGAAPILAVPAMKPAAFKAMALWALAFSVAGFLVGFLFGIPKALQGSAPPNGGGAGNGSSTRRGLQVNTNLEQISDWLTKIIVGVGLVELKQLPGHLRSAARWVAESISEAAGPPAATVSFAAGVIIFFSVIGFLAGYLITRLFLTGAFDRADPTEYQENKDTYAEDDLGKHIRKYWMPGDRVNAEADKKLKDWMTANGITPPLINKLISSAELADARKKVIEVLNIP